jgi:hypothetical protein
MWWLLLGVYIGVPTAMSGALRDAWSGYRRGERSLATAAGISCLVPALMVGGTAWALEDHLGKTVSDALLAGAGLLVVVGAACGVVGLASDRRFRASNQSLTGIPARHTEFGDESPCGPFR